MIRGIFCVIILSLVSVPVSFAQSNAEDLLRSRMRTPLLQAEGTITGEGVCWHAAYNMSLFMDEFRRSQDTPYLDAATAY